MIMTMVQRLFRQLGSCVGCSRRLIDGDRYVRTRRRTRIIGDLPAYYNRPCARSVGEGSIGSAGIRVESARSSTDHGPAPCSGCWGIPPKSGCGAARANGLWPTGGGGCRRLIDRYRSASAHGCRAARGIHCRRDGISRRRRWAHNKVQWARPGLRASAVVQCDSVRGLAARQGDCHRGWVSGADRTTPAHRSCDLRTRTWRQSDGESR